MAHRPEPTKATARAKWNQEHAKEARKNKDPNKPLTLPGSELWKAIANMESNMQALDNTRTISDQARGRSYDTGVGAGAKAIYETPALEPLKIPFEVAGEGLKTLTGNPSLNRPQEPFWNEEKELGTYLGADQIKANIANASTLRDDVKWRNIFNAVYGAEATDSIYEDIGGDENNIIPDDNKYGPYARGQYQKVDDPAKVDDNNEIINAVQVDNQLKEKIPIDTTDATNRTPEDIARDKWLRSSANTPAAKAFAQDDYRNKEWNKLRWEAQKRHKKLFDYNTDKEK